MCQTGAASPVRGRGPQSSPPRPLIACSLLGAEDSEICVTVATFGPLLLHTTSTWPTVRAIWWAGREIVSIKPSTWEGGGEYKNPHRQRHQSLGLSILHLGPDFRARSFGQAVRKDASARYTAAWSEV